MKTLTRLIESSVFYDAITASKSEPYSSAALEADHQMVQELIKEGIPVYGSPSMGFLGESDNKVKLDGLVDEVIRSHAIGFGEGFSEREVDLICKSLVLKWQAGGTGMSPDTYDKFCGIMEFADYPIYIPKHCSYSSGDVIPASHLLKAFLEAIKADDECDKFILPPTDILPFINGNFIQLGYCASLIKRMDYNWVKFCTNTAHLVIISNANESNFISFGKPTNSTKVISHLRQVCEGNKSFQDPISIRGTSQYLSSYFNDAERYLSILDDNLSTPSGSPLFLHGHSTPLSQSSFLSLEMTSATLSMINAAKMLLSVIVKRVAYLLSGEVENIPKDMSCSDTEMALVQVPKLLMAIDEKVSLKMTPSADYSTKSTLRDTEDGWSNGLTFAAVLDEVMIELNNALNVERYVHAYIAGKVGTVQDRMSKCRHKKNEDGTTVLLNGLESKECHYAIQNGLRAYMEHIDLDIDKDISQNVFDYYSMQSVLFDVNYR